MARAVGLDGGFSFVNPPRRGRPRREARVVSLDFEHEHGVEAQLIRLDPMENGERSARQGFSVFS